MFGGLESLFLAMVKSIERTICARSILAWRRQGDALGIDRHGVHSWRRLRLLDTLWREIGGLESFNYWRRTLKPKFGTLINYIYIIELVIYIQVVIWSYELIRVVNGRLFCHGCYCCTWCLCLFKLWTVLQLHVRDIHLRYEDDISIPGQSFAFGVTIDSISAQSADASWVSVLFFLIFCN